MPPSSDDRPNAYIHLSESSFPASSGPHVRLSINLAPDAAEALRTVCAEQGITVTEGVRRAIALLQLVNENRKSDGQVLFLVDGRYQELRMS